MYLLEPILNALINNPDISIEGQPPNCPINSNLTCSKVIQDKQDCKCTQSLVFFVGNTLRILHPTFQYKQNETIETIREEDINILWLLDKKIINKSHLKSI